MSDALEKAKKKSEQREKIKQLDALRETKRKKRGFPMGRGLSVKVT